MALVTTFATTPLTSWLYPPWYQKKLEAWKRGEIDWDTGKPLGRPDSMHESVNYDKLQAQKVQRLMVYLRLDTMPALLAFASLFGGKPQKPSAKIHPLLEQTSSLGKGTEDSGGANEEQPKRPIQAYGLRLLNLTDRSSSVMQVSELESYTAHDPVVNTFRTFGRLHNLAVSGEVVVVPESSFADVLTTRSSDSDLLVLPWSETGGMSEEGVILDKGTKNKLATDSEYTSFVSASLAHATTTTAVFINKNFGGSKNKNKDKKIGSRLTRAYSTISLNSNKDNVAAPIADRSHHIFFPFFGGEDDRAALRLVLQLAENPDVTATLVHFDAGPELLQYQTSSTQTAEHDSAFFASLRSSLPADLANRVVFESVSSSDPIKDALARASIEVGQSPRNAGDLVILGRNVGSGVKLVEVDDAKKGKGDDITRVESLTNTSREAGVVGTLGVLAQRTWEARVGASVLVVKAGNRTD